MSVETYPSFEPSRQLVEAASWRLTCELCRRHPSLQVVETHPGGGQYDCLDLLLPGDEPEERPRIAINRAGSVHFFPHSPRGSAWRDFWPEYLAAEDPRGIVDRVCTLADLTIPAHLPATTSSVLVLRFIAAFLAQAVLGRNEWECRNGYLDSSGVSGGRRDAGFRLFSGGEAALQTREPNDLLGEPAYRFWFLCTSGHPELCLETTGRAWDRRGTEYDLLELYQVRHRVWPVVSFVARDLLP